ncbi:MAG: hypothetical protein R3260_02550 [Pseudomonas sp.]|nr:hypothetical protein [Pseudomonas sp.]
MVAARLADQQTLGSCSFELGGTELDPNAHSWPVSAFRQRQPYWVDSTQQECSAAAPGYLRG